MSDNLTDRTFFLQTISMYKELVRDVILKTFQFVIHCQDISKFLCSPETRIKLQELIRNKVFNKPDSYKLQALNPNPDKFDIALLIKLIKYLGEIDVPERGWKTDPNPTDESIGADLIRLNDIRNKLLAHDPNKAMLARDECERVFAKVQAILIRILAKVDPESKESLDERLLEYKQLNVVTKKSEIQQYIEELSAVYEANEKCKKEVVELEKTAKELKLYFEKNPELYVRYVKLLFEGGRVVLHGFLEKEVAKVEKDLKTLLFEKRSTLMAHVDSIFHESMFGGDFNCELDPASWDIDLLASVILILSPNLCDDDAGNIRLIKSARLQYLEHALISIDSNHFIPYWTDLVSSLTSLSGSLERGKKAQVKGLIDQYKKKSDEDEDADRYLRELNSNRVTTKTLKDFYKETIARLVKYLGELEETGLKVKIEYLNIDLKLTVDCKNKRSREAAEDVLEEHFKASLSKSGNPVNCIRKETDSLFNKITANPTVTVIGVKRGCIILSLRTSTIHGLLYVIQLFEGQQFRSILDSLSAELYYLYGEAFLLQGHIPLECLNRILQQFKYSREKKTNKGVSLQIQCTSMEGIEHVLSVAGAESSTKILIDISDKISKEINEYISVDVEPDVLPMDDVLKMEEIFEKSGTHSVPLIENVNRKVTEMYVDDTVSEMAHRQEWTSNKTQKIRCLPDKLQELSRNINDSSTNTEINKLHKKAEGVCNCVTRAFTVTGSDVLKEKEKLSRDSCPSRDIERLSKALLTFKDDLRTCTDEILILKTSINNCVGVIRCSIKLKENEITAAKTEVDGLDKQIHLTEKEISQYDHEAFIEELGAANLEDRAFFLRRKSEEHKGKGLLWGGLSVAAGIVFAPITSGVSLGAGLVSAGSGMAMNFDDANDCERTAARLKDSARDKKERAQRKRTLKAEYESKKCTITIELRNCKTKIDHLARTCDQLTSLEGLLIESISGFERAIYITQDFENGVHRTLLQGDAFQLIKVVFQECPEKLHDEAHDEMRKLKLKWIELEQMCLSYSNRHDITFLNTHCHQENLSFLHSEVTNAYETVKILQE